MANDHVQDELADAFFLLTGAVLAVSALGAMASFLQNAAESAHAATRQSANAATLDLATTANSALLILGGQNQPARTSKSVKRKLRALKLRIDQNAAAPVVT